MFPTWLICGVCHNIVYHDQVDNIILSNWRLCCCRNGTFINRRFWLFYLANSDISWAQRLCRVHWSHPKLFSMIGSRYWICRFWWQQLLPNGERLVLGVSRFHGVLASGRWPNYYEWFLFVVKLCLTGAWAISNTVETITSSLGCCSCEGVKTRLSNPATKYWFVRFDSYYCRVNFCITCEMSWFWVFFGRWHRVLYSQAEA